MSSVPPASPSGTIASASISTSIAGSISRETSTMDVAGRICPNTAGWSPRAYRGCIFSGKEGGAHLYVNRDDLDPLDASRGGPDVPVRGCDRRRHARVDLPDPRDRRPVVRRALPGDLARRQQGLT